MASRKSTRSVTEELTTPDDPQREAITIAARSMEQITVLHTILSAIERLSLDSCPDQVINELAKHGCLIAEYAANDLDVFGETVSMDHYGNPPGDWSALATSDIVIGIA
jgi:hypothetical protein